MKALVATLVIAVFPGCASGLDCSDLYATKKNKGLKEGQNPTKALTGAELNAVNLRLKELCEALNDVIDTQGSTGGGTYPVPPPSITSCSPLSGGVGTEIVCQGTGLATMTSFQVNGTEAATRQIDSDGQVRATVAAGTTSGTIVITTTVLPPASGGTFTVEAEAPSLLPTSLAVAASDFPAAGISWVAPAGATVTSYTITKADDAGGVPSAAASFFSVVAPTTSLTLGPPYVENGKTYWFRVQALNGAISGPHTAWVSAFIPVQAESLPAGAPLLGTTHSLPNLPLSFWEPSITAQFGTASITDEDATADLQACLNGDGGLCPNWNEGISEIVMKLDSYVTYYAQPGDPEFLPYSNTYSQLFVACPLDSGAAWTTEVAGVARTRIRVPALAKAWCASTTDCGAGNPAPGPRPLNPGFNLVSGAEAHVQVVDEERNRIYTFYSYDSGAIGVMPDGYFHANAVTCDLLRGNDASIEAVLDSAIRYSCPGGASYPYGDAPSNGADCGLAGIGAGIAAGTGGSGGQFSATDSNGIHGPYGVIFPEDFDDTGWSGEAVGTLHHALRTSMPPTAFRGYQYPQRNPQNGDSLTSRIRNGQLMRLSPSYDCVANTGGASPTTLQRATRRFCKTMQVYGAYVDDAGNYGPEFFALSDWPGTGPKRNPTYSPWSAAGGANAEAVAFASGQDSRGVISPSGRPLPVGAWAHVEMVLPHGATYPARVVTGSGGTSGGTAGVATVGSDDEDSLSLSWLAADSVILQKVTMPEDGDVASVSFYVNGALPSANMKALVYADSSGTPAALVATSSVKAGLTLGWNAMTFGSPPSLTGGTVYWLAVVADAPISTMLTWGTNDGTSRHYVNAGNYATPPADLTGLGAASSSVKSLYLSYTP